MSEKPRGAFPETAPGQNGAQKTFRAAKLIESKFINSAVFCMDFEWTFPPPRAGQFFMVRPRRTSVFLGRPLSAAAFDAGTLRFLAAVRGRGTEELSAMRPGEEAELTGPLGNRWADFMPPPGENMRGKNRIALVGGGIGLAPLAAFAAELPAKRYDFYAGFKTAPDSGEKKALLGAALSGSRNLVIAVEAGGVSERGDAPKGGGANRQGRILDFFDPADYRAVFVCGPEPMLKKAAELCRAHAVPCYVSMERRMACGVGACLGCTVTTANGNRRCCADGPIFNACDVIF
ncbi:MAG: dihydroorotate dehydrogenase electron transfer subunit [Spirochaetaceae bacterium]|jgi:NAD(P)H-flavin reductase|nr:dihydroorotate dehydrogenase electron transfer subunit [Spirochaetaceae bacterium]